MRQSLKCDRWIEIVAIHNLVHDLLYFSDAKFWCHQLRSVEVFFFLRQWSQSTYIFKFTLTLIRIPRSAMKWLHGVTQPYWSHVFQPFFNGDKLRCQSTHANLVQYWTQVRLSLDIQWRFNLFPTKYRPTNFFWCLQPK